MEILKNPTFIWFAVGLVMFVIEMAGPGLVFLFFGIGAWVVVLLNLFLVISINAQIVIFLVTSAMALVFLRKSLKKVFYGHKAGEQDLGEDLDGFIGHKVTVKEKILLGSGGKVELNGTLWEAEAEEEIDVGEKVKIVSKDNLTLKVERFN